MKSRGNITIYISNNKNRYYDNDTFLLSNTAKSFHPELNIAFYYLAIFSSVFGSFSIFSSFFNITERIPHLSAPIQQLLASNCTACYNLSFYFRRDLKKDIQLLETGSI